MNTPRIRQRSQVCGFAEPLLEAWAWAWATRTGKYPRYPWVVGLIEWTLFKIGGRFEFFLLWLLFSRSHAVEPWTAVRKCFAVFTLAAFLRLAVFITPLLWRRCGSWHMSPLLSLSTLRDAQMTPKSCSNPECGEETDSSIIGKYSHFSASTTHIGYIEQ